MGEAGHWYERIVSPEGILTGKLVTQVPYAASNTAKAGQFRSPDMRDARKYGFAPSTTTIIKLKDQPGLRVWGIRHAVETACRTMRLPGETLEERVARIVQEHEAYAEEAADAGTQVHLALSTLLQGQAIPFQVLPEWQAVAIPAIAWMQEQGFELTSSEHAFMSPEGWAGTVDFAGRRLNKPCIADFKTQEFNALVTRPKEQLKGPNFYDEHGLQLASYDVGVNGPEADSDRYSVILSRTVPGLIALHKWEDNAKWNRRWFKLWEFWKEMNEWPSPTPILS